MSRKSKTIKTEATYNPALDPSLALDEESKFLSMSLAEKIAFIDEKHDGIGSFIMRGSQKNKFLSSLFNEFLSKNRPLSEKQIQAALRTREVSEAAYSANKKGATGLVMILQKSKSTRRVINLFGLQISLADSTGVNAGFAYVKSGNFYLGKISPSGEFLLVKESNKIHEMILRDAASDFSSSVYRHGRTTGSCALCGEFLKDNETRFGVHESCKSEWPKVFD